MNKSKLKPGHTTPETGEYAPVTENGAPAGQRVRLLKGQVLPPLPHGFRWKLVLILTRV